MKIVIAGRCVAGDTQFARDQLFLVKKRFLLTFVDAKALQSSSASSAGKMLLNWCCMWAGRWLEYNYSRKITQWHENNSVELFMAWGPLKGQKVVLCLCCIRSLKSWNICHNTCSIDKDLSSSVRLPSRLQTIKRNDKTSVAVNSVNICFIGNLCGV